MYFCYRQADGFRTNKDRTYRIGYAWSKDLTDWERNDGKAGIDISKEGWDSEMIEYAAVIPFKDKYYMFYNGNNYITCYKKFQRYVLRSHQLFFCKIWN